MADSSSPIIGRSDSFSNSSTCSNSGGSLSYRPLSEIDEQDDDSESTSCGGDSSSSSSSHSTVHLGSNTKGRAVVAPWTTPVTSNRRRRRRRRTQDRSNNDSSSSSPTVLSHDAHRHQDATVVTSSPLTVHSSPLLLFLPVATNIGTPPRAGTNTGRTRTMSTTIVHQPSVVATATAATTPNIVSSSSCRRGGDSVAVPIVSLAEGLQRKATPGLQSWSKLVTTLDGRDKFTKLLQYICRFLAWYWSSSSSTAFQRNASRRFAALKINLTNSRKAFRLGRSFLELEKIRRLGLWELFWRYYLRDVSSSQAAEVTVHDQNKGIVVGNNKPPPAWKLIGTALKMLGLMGFWAFDNVSFLTQSGVLDDYSSQGGTDRDRLVHRKWMVARASVWANRSYFAGALAGLATNWKIYWDYRKGELLQLEEQALLLSAEDDSSSAKYAAAREALKKARGLQFSLFLALLKSCCDVLVFSNNPGVDFWKKYRGRKMHEGFHCVCGLLSASTVLYNNYPDASSS